MATPHPKKRHILGSNLRSIDLLSQKYWSESRSLSGSIPEDEHQAWTALLLRHGGEAWYSMCWGHHRGKKDVQFVDIYVLFQGLLSGCLFLGRETRS